LKVVLDTLEAWQLDHDTFHEGELTVFLNNLKAWQDEYQPYDDQWIYDWIDNYKDMTYTYENIKLYFNIDPEYIIPLTLEVPLIGEPDTSFKITDEDNRVIEYSYNLQGRLNYQDIKEYYDNTNLRYSYYMAFSVNNNINRLTSESIYFKYNNDIPYIVISKYYNAFNGNWEGISIETYDMSGDKILSTFRYSNNNWNYSNTSIWSILNHYIETGQILPGE
jgi:hypothetical protein